MNKKIIALVSLTLSLNAFAIQPTNLATDKKDIKQYVNSGQYNQDISAITTQAQTYLAKRVSENKQLAQPKKLAIVLDIDETSLSNYPDMTKLDFGGTMKTINEKEGEGHDPAIKPTLALYNYAKNNHVAVFFITGRRENERANTIKNLQAAGYKNWNGLYLKPQNFQAKTASAYKTKIRQAITKQGYDIVLNMGDQQSDLNGGFADKTYKLPNPFYLVP
ncbi:MAG: acid phosphatase [Legionellales bacterium]|nr:acid phosphatase [Legionellales bacterium]|tara:strand:- start:274 stop:933 length:660 start_codon:yes stop_codon:yes gene_type:complete